MQRQRSLLGNDAATIRRVRDPFQLAAVLQAADYPLPEITRDVDQVPTDGSWLSKNARGSGGSHVRPWYGEPTRLVIMVIFRACRGRNTVQRRFLGGRWPGGAVGHDASADRCGLDRRGRVHVCWLDRTLNFTTIRPHRLEPDRYRGGSEFHLSGLFGVDAVLQSESLWPLEVNPRYTASVEVLERACGWHSIRLHVDACREARLPTAPDDRPPNPLCCGKAILYARGDITIGPSFGQLADRKNREQAWPGVADIPRSATTIRCGRPICTVLTDGVDLAAVEDRLKSLAAEIENAVYGNRQGVGSLFRDERR